MLLIFQGTDNEITQFFLRPHTPERSQYLPEWSRGRDADGDE